MPSIHVAVGTLAAFLFALDLASIVASDWLGFSSSKTSRHRRA